MTNLLIIKSQDMDLNVNNVKKQTLQSTYTYLSMELRCLKDTVITVAVTKHYQLKYVKESLTLRSIKKNKRNVELELEVENNKILDMPTH